MKNLLFITMFLTSGIWLQAQTVRTIKVPPSKDTTVVTFTSTVKQTVTVAQASIPVVVVPPPVVVTPPVSTTGYLALPKANAGTYNNVNGLVIEGKQFTNSTGGILQLNNCTNIIIRNCYFGASLDEAISLNGGSNITVENNLFANNKTGVYAHQVGGNLKIINNEFINPKGPMPRGQYIQLDKCSGVGNLIENNRGEAFEGESNPEDLISLYMSKGTAASPIIVRGNVFRGGGPSGSGGGIMAGDVGGQYVIVENNKLVNPGQYGIAASGGFNITIRNNEVYADRKSWNNIGFYVADYSKGAGCGSITIGPNKVNYTKADGSINNQWTDGLCGPVSWSQMTEGITLASMNVPAHLFKFITAAELLKIRGK